MTINNLSQINQQFISNQKQNQKTAGETVSTREKTNKKKLAVGLSAALGVAAIAIGGILYRKNSKAGSALQEGVKNFLDKEGNLIQNIKLEKGKAIASDGSLFTGVMETTTKSGRKVSFDYQDGFIIQSKVDGKLFKKFKNIDNQGHTIPRTKGTRIIEYDDNGNFITMSDHIYYDNGKIKRVVNKNKAIDFFPDGKIQAIAKRYIDRHSELNEDNLSKFIIYSAEIYDKKGVLVKEYLLGGADSKIIKYLPDGSKIELSHVNYADNKLPDTTVATAETKFDCTKAIFLKPNNQIIKEIEYKRGSNGLNKFRIIVWEIDKDGHGTNGAFILVNHKNLIEEAQGGFKDDYGYLLRKDKCLLTKGQSNNTMIEGVEKENTLRKIIDFIEQNITDAKELGIYKADKIDKTDWLNF